MHTIKWVIIMLQKFKILGIVSIPLIVGLLSTLFVDFNFYKEINLPSVAPPSILFPIVWTILYVLIGISLYLILRDGKNKENITLFITQLLINFIWVICFFRFRLFFGSFIIIIILDCIVLYSILEYYKYNKVSSYLLIPYFLWIVFASYLNWMVFVLN